MDLEALIVDDEPRARRRMRSLLSPHTDIAIIGECQSLDEAVDALTHNTIDVIFLDIQLRGETGFDLFDRIGVTAHVVFVTAYDEHAIRAFEVNALDYLVKPVAPQRLAKTLDRLRQPLGAPTGPEPEPSLQSSDRVSIKSNRGRRFIRLEEITHIRAADDFSELWLADGETVLCDTPISRWKERLPASFIRIHRSTVIHKSFVDVFERAASGWQLRLRGVDEPLPVSRRMVKTVRADLEDR